MSEGLASVTMVATAPALAAPGERCRIRIPGTESGFECELQLCHGVVVSSVVHTSVECAEERLDQVQPRAIGRRVAQDQPIAALRCGCPNVHFGGVVGGCSDCPE